VLVLDTQPLIPSSAEVRQTIADVATSVAAAGASVLRHSELLPDPVESARIYMRLLLASVAASYPADAYAQAVEASAGIAPDDHSLAAERSRGATLGYREWIATDTARVGLRAEWAALFEEFDVVICPAAPTTAFRHDHSPDQWSRTIPIDGVEHSYADQLVWAGIASATGLPATVAPVAVSAEGLPIGVQLLGPLYEDLTPIRFAELLERELGGFRAPLLA
jgi:amidase